MTTPRTPTTPHTPRKKASATRAKVAEVIDPPTRRPTPQGAERNGTHGTQGTVRPQGPEAAERAVLWANPAFQAALEAGRASVARGERKTLEELDREKPLSPEEIAEADAWLDEYERRLEQEAQARREAMAAPGGTATA